MELKLFFPNIADLIKGSHSLIFCFLHCFMMMRLGSNSNWVELPLVGLWVRIVPLPHCEIASLACRISFPRISAMDRVKYVYIYWEENIMYTFRLKFKALVLITKCLVWFKFSIDTWNEFECLYFFRWFTWLKI